MPALQETVVPFTTQDGLECNLIRVQGDKPAPKGPVLLSHGAGVRANVFRAPVQTTVVDYLVENGYEVWLENWRASIDVKPNNWNLDKAALYDHPEAVKTVVKETGWGEIKAIIHCQGSTSFMMSVVAGLVPQVKTIVSNAVSLHPVVPSFSRVKLKYILPVLSLFTSYLSPSWGLKAPTPTAKAVPARRQIIPSRVPQRRLQAGQLHLRHRLPRALAAREPQPTDPRLDEARVRLRADHLLPADGALRG